MQNMKRHLYKITVLIRCMQKQTNSQSVLFFSIYNMEKFLYSNFEKGRTVGVFQLAIVNKYANVRLFLFLFHFVLYENRSVNFLLSTKM